ncbi:hypothetical protein [Xylella taiwanensis]|nr:hypothetical protein [Xylella taiwanensis]
MSFTRDRPDSRRRLGMDGEHSVILGALGLTAAFVSLDLLGLKR